jgi:hypothetical protein
MVEPAPSVGRIVHYVSHGTPPRPDGSQEYPSQCRAAVITYVDTYQDAGPDGTHTGHVSLCVMNPTGLFFNQHVFQDEEEKRGGSWHWPERT